jgi:PAS domain S-box-containing protein
MSAIAAAVFSIAFLTWAAFRIGGDVMTIAVDDTGQVVAALVAAVSCGLAAQRTDGRLRLAWGLLAASAASRCIGEVIESVYEVGLGTAVPFPSAADIGFLAAMPFAIAGILSFSFSSRGTSVGVRLWVDRAIVFLALLFVAWTLGLNMIYDDQDPLIQRLIDLAYPIGDIAIGTVLVLAIRRAADEQHGRLLLLLGGLASNVIADSGFVYLQANGAYALIGSVLDAGWVVGYLLIALSALWPSSKRDKTSEDKPIDVWQLALPWTAVLAAGLAAVLLAMRGHSFDVFSTLLVGVLAILLMISQVLAHRESLALLIMTKLSAATLNDMITYAPLGVVRIGPKLTILQANPSFASMLRTTVEQLTGAPIDRFFSRAEIAKASGRFRQLSGQGEISADFDTQATRADGTSIWVHWTASTIHKAGGAVDYHLVMLEDISARKAAEAVTASNLQILKRLDKVKSQFLTRVSHEFRTALVGIQGFSEFIRDSEDLDVADVKSFANDIYDDALRLDRSLNEMLELDKAKGGSSDLEMAETDLNRLLADAVAKVRLGTSEHVINIDIEPLPAVRADADMLSLVVASLLVRAVQYSPARTSITLCARAIKDQVEVSIKDESNSVAADLEAQLLGTADEQEHTGVRVLGGDLGLPMARQIVEMHGGRLWFEADAAGTTWHFTLPVRAAVADPAVPVG